LLHEGRRDAALFGEKGATFLIAFPEERWVEVEEALGAADSSGVSWVAYDFIGYTGGERFKIHDFIDVGLDELGAAYEEDLFEQHAPEGGHIG
jgi:hypothetical protein